MKKSLEREHYQQKVIERKKTHQGEEELGERGWRRRITGQRIAKLQETHVALELTKLPWLHSSLLASWS
jgi:hypothetical protein